MRKIKIVQVIVIGDTAYVPSKGVYPSGLFTSIEPVYSVKPTMDDLLPIVRQMANTEPKLMPPLTKEGIKVQRNLLPRVTRTRSWKRLGQAGISYLFDITENGFVLEMSKLDDKGRWEFDISKKKRYPVNTDLSLVVQDILDDLETRQSVSPVE